MPFGFCRYDYQESLRTWYMQLALMYTGWHPLNETITQVQNFRLLVSSKKGKKNQQIVSCPSTALYNQMTWTTSTNYVTWTLHFTSNIHVRQSKTQLFISDQKCTKFSKNCQARHNTYIGHLTLQHWCGYIQSSVDYRWCDGKSTSWKRADCS